jgi:hypothetical protein
MTIMLAALLAWPWNVVLAAAESVSIATVVQYGTLHVQTKSLVHRLVRHGHWNSPNCTVIALDYDRDEEGDDGSPFSPSSAFHAIAFHPCGNTPGFAVTFTALPDTIVARERRCHLRC